ncbi:hypothetical protein D3C75_1134670 [compost metagenome]
MSPTPDVSSNAGYPTMTFRDPVSWQAILLEEIANSPYLGTRLSLPIGPLKVTLNGRPSHKMPLPLPMVMVSACTTG